MVPQNRLNPVSRDRSSNVIRRRKRMKNSSIAEANNSVIVTRNERRLKGIKAKKPIDARSIERVKRVDSKKKSISEVPKPGGSRGGEKRKKSTEEVDSDSPKHVKINEGNKLKRKESSEEEFEMGKGLNGEPSMIKVRVYSFAYLFVVES